jgi:NAD(P)-dependent dehydrogenase (short-subunit alcohol dehydrogenase family)
MSTEQKGTAFVTGASQGLGQAIALRLADDGFDVAINDIPSKVEHLKGLANEITQKGRKCCVVPADVTVEVAVQDMVAKVVKELGGLDVVSADLFPSMIAHLASTRT